MPFFSWDQILNRPLGDLQLAGQMAVGAKNFACSMWNDYTSQFYEGAPPVLGIPAVRQFWNTLCFSPPETPNLPPPPAFTGGQCQFKYTLSGTVNVFPSTVNCNRNPDSASVLSGVYWGPILSLFLDEPFGTCGGYKAVKIECYGIGSGPRRSSPITLNVTAFSYGRFLSLNNFAFTPTGGEPDNCGNPPTRYPETNPTPQPGDRFFDIDLEGDSTNDFSPRLVWNDIDFRVPVSFDFEVGTIVLDVGGVEVNFNGGNGWRLNDRSPAPPPPPELYIPFSELDSEESPEDQIEAEETNDPSIKYVVVNITAPPLHGSQRTILQPNPGDSTFFAGYFSWTYGDHRFPEKPVRKLSNIFYNDCGADGFRYYRINGAGLRHVIYRARED